MKPVIAAGLGLAAVLVLAPYAAAQEPEQQPPPPPPKAERAVPRSEVRQRDPETTRAPEARQESGGAERRGAVRTGEERTRERVPVSAATPSERPAASERVVATERAATRDEQGAQPRGNVRRPPEGSEVSGAASSSRAIPRSEAPRPSYTPVYVYPDYYRYYRRYYDPWNYGFFGVGAAPWFYSPWGWDPGFYGAYGYPGYGYGSGSGYGSQSSSSYDIGSLKLKVKPRDAEVYVDGYFAGHVDDFDGIFQALKLASGGYRVEVRKPGFETLVLDVIVQPDRTITFKRQMQQIP